MNHNNAAHRSSWIKTISVVTIVTENMTKEAIADTIRGTPITRKQDLQRQSPNSSSVTEIVLLEQLGHLRFIAISVSKLWNHVITGSKRRIIAQSCSCQ